MAHLINIDTCMQQIFYEYIAYEVVFRDVYLPFAFALGT